MAQKQNEEKGNEKRPIETLVMRIISEKEEIIRNAINDNIGTDWTLESISERCRIEITPNQHEFLVLDNNRILEFYPQEVSMKQNDTSVKMVSEQKYKKLYA